MSGHWPVMTSPPNCWWQLVSGEETRLQAKSHGETLKRSSSPPTPRHLKPALSDAPWAAAQSELLTRHAGIPSPQTGVHFVICVFMLSGDKFWALALDSVINNILLCWHKAWRREKCVSEGQARRTVFMLCWDGCFFVKQKSRDARLHLLLKNLISRVVKTTCRKCAQFAKLLWISWWITDCCLSWDQNSQTF